MPLVDESCLNFPPLRNSTIHYNDELQHADPGENLTSPAQNGPPKNPLNTHSNQKSQRKKWSVEEYTDVMWCHYFIQEKTGTINLESTFNLWKQRNPTTARTNLGANKLATQRRYIERTKKLSEDQLQRIKSAVCTCIEA